jgi:tRNA (Thr-GGU) A37 N-methylase
MEQIIYSLIGVIPSPFKELAGTPIQPTGAQGIRGRIEIEPQFDHRQTDRIGWLHGAADKARDTQADNRFDSRSKRFSARSS